MREEKFFRNFMTQENVIAHFVLLEMNFSFFQVYGFEVMKQSHLKNVTKQRKNGLIFRH